MKKFIYLLVVILTMHITVYGQSEENGTGKSGQSDPADRFFIAATSSTYLDIVTSRVEMLSTTVINPDPNTGQAVRSTVKVPHQTRCWSIVSFGFEPRYNLYEMDDNSALAVSVPISFGLGMTQPVNADVEGVEGVGSLQIPLLIKLYAGNHSTLNTQKDFGISIGGGIEFNKTGLIDLSTESEPVSNKGWFMPVGTLGFHFWRGVYPLEINIKYGVTSYREYDIDKDGDTLIDDFGNPITKRGKGSSFKITFVSLLNY